MRDKNKDYNIVTMTTSNGEDVDFIDIAGVWYKGRMYSLLQPLNLLEGMGEDEALVFEVTSSGGADNFTLVLDDNIIDAVFNEYYKQLK